MPHISRRTLIGTAGGALAALAVAENAGTASATGRQAPPTPHRPRGVPGIAFIEEMTDAYPQFASKPRLPQSYSDESGLFSTAFIYDSAVAVCAALVAGKVALARTIGDGIVFAQEHDPGYSDGRLRQGYNVGPYTFYDGSRNDYGLELPDGTANIGWQFGFLGTAVGDMAWPGLALAQLALATRDRRYAKAAVRIGTWILDNAVNPNSLGGFRFGVTAANAPVPNVSTEHNIDCVAFFRLLQRLDRSRDWDAAERRAAMLVNKMWVRKGYYYTGSNDGSTLNTSVIPLDPQTWGWLAMPVRGRERALDWALNTLGTTDAGSTSVNSQVPAGASVSGVTFSDASLTSTASYNGLPVCRDAVWFEGTGQLACAFASRGDRRAQARLLADLAHAHDVLGAGQKAGGTVIANRGMVAASSVLDSGFGYGYFQVQHVGATGWWVLAQTGRNPMRALSRW